MSKQVQVQPVRVEFVLPLHLAALLPPAGLEDGWYECPSYKCEVPIPQRSVTVCLKSVYFSNLLRIKQRMNYRSPALHFILHPSSYMQHQLEPGTAVMGQEARYTVDQSVTELQRTICTHRQFKNTPDLTPHMSVGGTQEEPSRWFQTQDQLAVRSFSSSVQFLPAAFVCLPFVSYV